MGYRLAIHMGKTIAPAMVLAELASVRYICSNNLDRHYPSKIV